VSKKISFSVMGIWQVIWAFASAILVVWQEVKKKGMLYLNKHYCLQVQHEYVIIENAELSIVR